MIYRKVPGNVSPPLQFFRLRKRHVVCRIVFGGPENKHFDWFILPLPLPTPTMQFSLERKWRSHKRNGKKMETFWFFQLRFRRAYASAYDSVFRFSLGHKRSYDSDYDSDSDSDSVANENQPLNSYYKCDNNHENPGVERLYVNAGYFSLIFSHRL